LKGKNQNTERILAFNNIAKIVALDSNREMAITEGGFVPTVKWSWRRRRPRE
jgi:hypothetical protein